MNSILFEKKIMQPKMNILFLFLFFLPQSRNCFERIVDIEPGKEKMMKGSDINVFFFPRGHVRKALFYVVFVVDASCMITFVVRNSFIKKKASLNLNSDSVRLSSAAPHRDSSIL